MRVAAQLGIPLLTFNFEKQYREKIVDELFKGYEAGETPNPDVLCNEYIKFGLFAEEASKLGMDYIAMGHYARVTHTIFGRARLLRGKDSDKDQSYFLHRVSQQTLRKSLFPIGSMKKSRVRQIASRLGMSVAKKPDSQGICFIGKIDMADFLRKKIPSKPGDIVNEKGVVLGQHQGLDSFTVGQRHGFAVSAGAEPWYVVEKNILANSLVIVQGATHPLLFTTRAYIKDLHWTRGIAPKLPLQCMVQVRYRQEPVSAILEKSDSEDSAILQMTFIHPVKAVAIGQSAVIYQDDECLGGGILTKK
jgi:tRNA-specific 2-thiouridylase